MQRSVIKALTLASVCFFLLLQGCNNGVVFYQTDSGEVTSDNIVFYREMTATEFTLWYPQNLGQKKIGTYSVNGGIYSVLSIGNDPDLLFLKFRGGDVRPVPHIRTDVELPDTLSTRPEKLRPFFTDGSYDIREESIIGIFWDSLLNQDNICSGTVTGDGYAFACCYDGFPQIASVIYIQPTEASSYTVSTVHYTNDTQLILHLISDEDHTATIRELFHALEKQGVPKGYTIGERDSLVGLW